MSTMAGHLPCPGRILRPTVEKMTASLAARTRKRRRVDEEGLMGDKSPKKSNSKKPGKTLKEKRADKNAKREEKRPGFGG